MKKLILLLLFSIGIGTSYAMGKKPLVSVEPTLLKTGEDVNLLKNEVKELKGDMSAVKLDIPELKKLVEANIQMQADIKANLDTNLKAIAGFQNQIQETKTTAGRDVVQTTTNETELMKYIIKGLVGLCSTLIGIIFFIIKALLKRTKQKAFYKEQTYLHTKDENDVIELRKLHDLYVAGKLGKQES